MLHLKENKLLYNKQFGFQQCNSTDHAILELIDQLGQSFEENKFTLGVFIDLSKAFDTVIDHSILLNKLRIYGVKNSNLKWFESYLDKRKQFVGYQQNQTKINYVTCGGAQGSILGPLLFIIYVNDLKNASNLLDPIMFADDTNLFYSHKNIKTLFETMNQELGKLNTWFQANKLSLNTGKTKYTFFHKLSKNEDIPLVLPALSINAVTIKREKSIKSLGVLIDENITWKDHIQTIENKISKKHRNLIQSKIFVKSAMSKKYLLLLHKLLSKLC